MFADKRVESVKCFTREAHDKDPNDTYCHYAQFYYIQSLIALWVILLSFIILTVIELSDMMLSVMTTGQARNCSKTFRTFVNNMSFIFTVTVTVTSILTLSNV